MKGDRKLLPLSLFLVALLLLRFGIAVIILSGSRQGALALSIQKKTPLRRLLAPTTNNPHLYIGFPTITTTTDETLVVPNHHPRRHHDEDNHKLNHGRRRQLLHSSLVTFAAAIASIMTFGQGQQPCHAYNGYEDIIITLKTPGDRLGVELYDVTIGTPPLSAVAVRSVVPPSSTSSSSLLFVQPGMVLREYERAVDVVQRIRNGPYPVQLTFRNLAAGGDAISDLGTPLVSAQDALALAQKTSGSSSGSMTPSPSTNAATTLNSSTTSYYSITTLEGTFDTSTSCGIQSRRGDVLEIDYEAHLLGPDGPIYDSSARRGTGQPYQMVLGSGDMLPGVDQGLYDMCPGQVRGIQIPPALAYGINKGNRLFGIPPNVALYWKVQLISVQSIRQGNPMMTRDELEGRADYVR